ncbi:MAG: hypothetical protein QGF03_02920, partial [SAR324 cluster bacterium]|nr:hypothetical protein [SAR324 cluster bacterium]
MPVLSKIRPVKGWDFAERRRFPVRCPRVTVIFRRTTLKRETIQTVEGGLMLRGTLENVLSGMKAGFKAILNLEHPFARKKMFNLKSSSKLSATLLALILGASVFMAGQVWAAKYVTDPTTGKTWTAPEYGGTLTQGVRGFPPNNNSDGWSVHPGWASHLISGVNEKLAFVDWGQSRDIWTGTQPWTTEMFIGNLAESWSMP